MDRFQAENKHGDWLPLVKGGKVWAGWSQYCYTEKLIKKPKRADLAGGLMNNLNVDDDSAPVAMFASVEIYRKIQYCVLCLRGEVSERKGQ